MRLILNNINNSNDFMRHQNRNSGVSQNKLPQNSSLSFGANFSKAIDKLRGSSEVLSKEQCKFIDNAIGDNFFTQKLKASGYDTNASSIKFKQTNFFTDLFNTVKYPLHDMWFDIAASFIKNPKKDGILDKYLKKAEVNKSRQAVLDIVSQFDKNNPNSFIDVVTKNISKRSSNYKTRDERTLNRMLTSTVSALYSANDFYNISMLQKDDKKEANRAQKSRLKQEMSRMALSAGLTFITMGALDKHIKNNMYLSALSIAISALISEVGSRLINKTPLRPLTPEQAKNYAQKKAQKNAQKENAKTKPEEINQQPKNQENLSFKANYSEHIFKDFAANDGSFMALNVLKNSSIKDIQKSEEQPPKKKSNTAKIVLGAMAAMSTVHILAQTKAGKGVSSKLKGLENLITSKKQIIGKDEITKLKDELDSLKGTQGLESVIEKYSSILKDKTSLEIKKDRFLVSGLYSGLTKIFKTLYTILSAPGKLLIQGYNKLSGKQKTDNSKALEKSQNKMLTELYNIFKNNEGNREEIINQIKKRTRNFEPNIETGELANFSRTLVTAITTYFFVNDYRNKVLIESNGKDTQGASYEVKQRLSHKLANFIINGTIMNLGNSVFKNQLNSSLFAAGAIAVAEEVTNEALVRKSTCQPILKKHSSKEILDFEEKQLNKKGFMGAWSRLFRKLTGKKTLSQKTQLKTSASKEQNNKEVK